MELESIKTILFVFTLIALLSKIFSAKENDKRRKMFFVYSAIVTTILILAIEIKIHHLLRSEFNIPNTLIYSIILVTIIFYFYKFSVQILNPNLILLILSLGCIGFALILDLLTDVRIISFTSSDFVEEIFRILGALFWMLYYSFYPYKDKI